MPQYRKDRLCSEIVRETGKILLHEIQDPRLGFVTVTRAKVSDDYQYARIFVSVMGGQREKKMSMQALRHACGYVQRELSRRIRIRTFPEVTFELDESIEKAFKMQELLDDLEKLDHQLHRALEPLQGQVVVFSHPVYQYLTRRYGLDARSVHFEPDEDPGDGWHDLDGLMAERSAELMIWEAEPLPSTRDALAERNDVLENLLVRVVAERDDVLSMLVQARHEDGSPMSDAEIRDELRKPGRDPREQFAAFEFADVHEITDLEIGDCGAGLDDFGTDLVTDDARKPDGRATGLVKNNVLAGDHLLRRCRGFHEPCDTAHQAGP